MAGKFRKKPVEIEAIQWDGTRTRLYEICDWATTERLFVASQEDDNIFLEDGWRLSIMTLEGAMAASVGDWIVKGVQGECYPVKPDIFEATYEPVEDGTRDS